MTSDRSILRTRRAPLRVVFLTVAAQLVVLWLLIRFGYEPLTSLETATGGWVDFSLPAGLLLFLLVVVPLVFVWAGLRPRDIGLDRSKLRVGLVVVGLLWLTTQAALAIAALATGDGVRLAAEWTAGFAGSAGPAGASGPRAANGARDAGHALGFLIAMLVVIPIGEEAVYRGFVLPQLWLRLGGDRTTEKRRADGTGAPAVSAASTWRARVGLLAAIAGSSLLFTLAHLPATWTTLTFSRHAMVWSLTSKFLAGVFFALIYVRTTNLWVAGGVHALRNAPTPLFTPVISQERTLLLLTLVLLVVWPMLPVDGRRPVQPRITGSPTS